MKIKNIKINNKHKLIELQITKSKLYKKNFENEIQNVKSGKTKQYIKKFAHIIYEYHINNKKILFINFPIQLQKKHFQTVKKTHQHIFINENSLLNNNTQKYADLILYFNSNKNNSILLPNLSNIPILTINENLMNSDLTVKYSYKILGTLKFVGKQINNNFLFSILQSIFKKSTLKRKQNFYKKRLKFKFKRKKHYR